MRMTTSLLMGGVVILFTGAVVGTVVIPLSSAVHQVPAEGVKPYSPLEWGGRQIYIKEGCWYCHSQQVRPVKADEGLGPVSRPGDYFYDKPHLLGTERTGPDLFNVGGKYPDAWHLAHLKDPQSVSPGSIMPSFSYLSDDETKAVVAFLQSMAPRRGKERAEAPTGPAVVIPPGEAAKTNPVPATKESIAAGRTIFSQFCASCHGPEGRGDGPAAATLTPRPANLAAKKWKYGTGREGEVFYIISNGVPGTAMPPWKASLTEKQRWEVVNFVLSLPE